MLDHLFPVIGVLHGELVFKKIDVCPLVSPVSQEVDPVTVHELGWRRRPCLQFFDLVLVNVMELRRRGAEQVGRAQDMSIVIVKAKLVINDGVVYMVGLEQVFEGASPAIRVSLNVMHLDRGQIDGLGLASST